MPTRLLPWLLICLLSCALRAHAADDVRIGAYVNDIQDIDLQTHSARLDVYVWFRWKNPAINPAKSMEFMNSFNPSDHVRTVTYDPPKAQPDGSLYSFVRIQGQFSVKFPLQRYPFDQQTLLVAMEDSEANADQLHYVPDGDHPALNPRVSLPGFDVGTLQLTVEAYPYNTSFGDLSVAPAAYSRALLRIPVQRPWLTSAIKIFMPVLLILLCATPVFFVQPTYVEGRLGVGITALLTLVALQLTTTSSLPDVDYLMMIDKIYFLTYLFIVVALAQVVYTSWMAHENRLEAARVSDRRAFWFLLAGYGIGAAAIMAATLA